MPINYTNGTLYSAPRVIETKDTRSGCPGTAADGSVLISQTFTVDNPCIYMTHGRIIFNASNAGKGRADFYIAVNGNLVKQTLDTALNSNNTPASWEELDATHSGTLAAGTHTITVVGSNGSNCWGCGSDWGQLTTIIWECA